ncbi:MAG: SpoIIIAH-like family protein [Angelakisella sp.]|nr:SpoIIIAH-like family protein [Angelakisella sp.]
MKMNMILSKRHIILSALILALSIAVYLNWEYVKTNNDFTDTDKVAVSGEVAGEGAEETAAYGEAYFAEAKLSRTKSRDEAIEAMKYMLADASLTSEQMAELTAQAATIAKSIETEGKIENLVKAHGFADCMVYLEEDKIDVLVKCDEMTDSEAAQIKDVILGEVDLPSENISIIEIK